LAKLTKKEKKRGAQINKMIKERGEITTDTTGKQKS